MRLIRFFLALALLIPAVPGRGQAMEGVIVYEEILDWSRITSRMEFLSQEEKDRMKLTWGNYAESKREKKLVFNQTSSLYSYAASQGEYGDGRYTYKNPVYFMHRDFGKNTMNDWIESLGRVYHIEDSLQVPKWRVMNKIKDILGHVCMMATTEDTIRGLKVTAWFADDLPVQVGPGAYFGLPGAILEIELNDGDAVVTAKKIELRPVNEEVVPSKKMKGRKLTARGYEDLVKKHFDESKKTRRNPFWSLPLL